jgi:DegV family protein with EDD domain
MEQKIGIVTDSSCDLPPQLAQEHEIEVVPLVVHMGAETYHDGELSADEFWEKASEVHPASSQPPVGVFEEVFERLIASGKQVLCVTVTAKHSGTFNAACLAAQRFGQNVKVLDSLSVSWGLGAQALLAAQAARVGRSMQEILATLEDFQARMRLTIVLDTLEYLRRGGRADGFIAVASRMTRALNIKLIINMVEGRLRLLSAARSFNGGVRRVLDMVEQMGPLEHLAVTHARRNELAEKIADQLAERVAFPREHVWVRETGAVLSMHAGPGVVAVLAVPGLPTSEVCE